MVDKLTEKGFIKFVVSEKENEKYFYCISIQPWYLLKNKIDLEENLNEKVNPMLAKKHILELQLWVEKEKMISKSISEKKMQITIFKEEKEDLKKEITKKKIDSLNEEVICKIQYWKETSTKAIYKLSSITGESAREICKRIGILQHFEDI